MGHIDSHAHLTFKPLADQVEACIARSREADIEAIVTIGTNPADSREAVVLAQKHEGYVFATAGVHPHEAERVNEKNINAVASLWRQPGVVGIGEIGLDYHYDFADRKTQRDVFGAQLARAAGTQLPLVIHARESVADVVAMLADHGFDDRKVVFHCFTGSDNDAVLIANHGWRISFTGVVTFRKSDWLQPIARDYPADELMVETDAPYLSPEPVRKARPNEPANLIHIIRHLANLRGVDETTLAEQINKNTRAFFEGVRSHQNEVKSDPIG